MATFEQKLQLGDRLRDQIVATIANAVPADTIARQRLTSLRASLDQIGDVTMYDLASLDQSFKGSLSGGVADEIARIALGRSACDNATALFAPFMPLVNFRKQQRARGEQMEMAMVGRTSGGPSWRR